MEFRWIAIIALWTMLAGPMFDSPMETTSASRSRRPVVNEVSVAPADAADGDTAEIVPVVYPVSRQE